MRIGFFDSGIGGISVLSEALELLPDNDYLFYADVDHVPYGERTTQEIAHYAKDNVRFLLSEGAEAVVVACNTATAVAIKDLRKMTDIPVIGMEPAVKPAVELFGPEDRAEDRRRILVAATPVTLSESKLRDLIDRVDRSHRVDLIPLPGLVPLAENEAFGSDEARHYLSNALSDVDPHDYAAFVMGCTHFIYFAPLFRELLGKEIRLIDGNRGTVRRLASVTGLEIAGRAGTADGSRVTYFRSGRRVTDKDSLDYFARLLARCRDIRSNKDIYV